MSKKIARPLRLLKSGAQKIRFFWGVINLKLHGKYFASDRDKYLFFVENGQIEFIKFSAVYGNLPEYWRKELFKKFKKLPMLSWKGLVNERRTILPPL